MNDLDALRLMVKHFPGGADVVALRIGKSVEVLRKELAGAPGFKLGYLTATLIRDLCIEARSEHCMALTNVFCAGSGGFIELPVREMGAPVNVQKTMGDVVKEMSDVTVSTLEADADGVISDNDLKRSQREIGEAREALQKLELALIAKNAAGKHRAAQAQTTGEWVREFEGAA